MTITLAPQTEAKLKGIAAREGRDPNALAETMLSYLLEETERDFQETAIGIERGRQAYADGRSRPFSEYAAEVLERRQQRDAALAQGTEPHEN